MINFRAITEENFGVIIRMKRPEHEGFVASNAYSLAQLYEESGVTNADLYAVCDYKGYRGTSFAYGMTFLAVVHELGELPESEMDEVCLFEELPDNLTYPKMTPVLVAEAEKFLK